MLSEIETHLAMARDAPSGRSAITLFHGRHLAQTLVAMAEGVELHEHENPGEATLQVLWGRVRLQAGDESWEGSVGDLMPIPQTRHLVLALEDSAVLLTVAHR
ncbi:MAG TPA: LuxR family transcriptional regulator [Actinomycetota bacterium]|nr:LuxR family transcriptional regulator [Actinomycetota bacterium]